jgi:hypothetical protein
MLLDLLGLIAMKPIHSDCEPKRGFCQEESGGLGRILAVWGRTLPLPMSGSILIRAQVAEINKMITDLQLKSHVLSAKEAARCIAVVLRVLLGNNFKLL